jgi:hypothetical protein
MSGSQNTIICFRERRYPSAGNLSEFELPIVLILKFEALGQLGRADDAEIALDQALAISPQISTSMSGHVHPGSALRSMPTWWKAYARQDWENDQVFRTAC